MRVIVSDPYATIDDTHVQQVGLDDLLAESDFVVCLAPATPQTANLMNAQTFASMKAGAYFINAARGELVDDAALLAALECGHLAGCALDVGRAADQMPSPELAAHPRVIATPHIGGLTPGAIEHQSMETVAQTQALFQGRMPAGAVNAAHAYRLSGFAMPTDAG
jgi:D-3-phosphoglycerate dehydrogenase